MENVDDREKASSEKGPVNGMVSPLNLSIKLILYAWASSNIHHQLYLWAFNLVLQQSMSSVSVSSSMLSTSSSAAPCQLPLHSKASLHRFHGGGGRGSSQVESEDYYSTPTLTWLSSYYSKGFFFYLVSRFVTSTIFSN